MARPLVPYLLTRYRFDRCLFLAMGFCLWCRRGVSTFLKVARICVIVTSTYDSMTSVFSVRQRMPFETHR